MSANVLRLAFLLGLALAATGASSAVAWKFGWASQLGTPWFGWFYNPLLAWRWWHAWGSQPAYRPMFLGGLSAAAALAVVPVLAARLVEVYAPLRVGKDPSRDEGFGTVRSLMKEARQIRRRGNGVVLGVDPKRWRWRQRVLRDDGDGHLLILGPSRFGKGAGHVVPTLLGHDGSMLVFDPKHELFGITGRRRAEFGPVHVVDPTDIRSARFNPLLELRDRPHRIGDCHMMAAIMATSGNGPLREDPFWDSSAHKLLAALMVHVVESSEPTLDHVWRLTMEIASGCYPASGNGYVASTLAAHRRLDNRTRSGVDETLATHLKYLADPMIRHMTGASDFRAGDLQAADQPVTVFLSIPVSDGKRLRPFTRLVLESIVSTMTHHLHVTSDGRPKQRPVLGLIDEFPQLGRLDIIERQMPIMASYGLRLALVCQDADQIEGLYGGNQAITANCLTVCYIPGFSKNSLRLVSGWAGQHAVAHSSKQLSAGIRGSSSLSQSETRVALLEPGEMLKRGRHEVLIFVHGEPTYVKKLRYWKEPEFRGLFDDQRTLLELPPAPPLPPERWPGAALPTSPAGQPALATEGLTPDERDMVESVEELLQDMPAAAQAALRRRLGAESAPSP